MWAKQARGYLPKKLDIIAVAKVQEISGLHLVSKKLALAVSTPTRSARVLVKRQDAFSDQPTALSLQSWRGSICTVGKFPDSKFRLIRLRDHWSCREEMVFVRLALIRSSAYIKFMLRSRITGRPPPRP